jgi:hypothetical protein
MSKQVSEKSVLERARGRADECERTRPSQSRASIESDLFALQSAAGNRAVGELLRGREDSRGIELACVNIHAGAEAGKLAHAMGAAAFTRGRDVYLGEGVDLATELGHRVLAH